MSVDSSSVLSAVPATKRCTKCSEEKPVSDFYKDLRKKSGYSSHCKACNSIYCHNWRISNSDKYKSIIKSYCENNRELLRQKSIEYRSTHSEKCKASKKAWRLANPEKRLASHRKRRARKRNAEGSHTAVDIQQLLVFQKSKCAVCHISIKDGYHVDHVIPLALGGGNSKDNLQLLCPPCNISKNAKHPIDFMRSRGMLL